jgi:hypothetical protein
MEFADCACLRRVHEHREHASFVAKRWIAEVTAFTRAFAPDPHDPTSSLGTRRATLADRLSEVLAGSCLVAAVAVVDAIGVGAR